MLSSTIRMYQHRGLVDPPVRRGRVGYYGPGHVERLRLIAQLRDRGFSLASIKELCDGLEHGANLRAVLGVGGESSTWRPEPPRRMSFADLAAALPQVEFTPDMVRRVVALGLVEPDDDGAHVIVTSPEFLEIGRRLAALGVPPDVILDQYELLREETDAIAMRFTDVFRTHFWEPMLESGRSRARVRRVINALEELGPLAESVTVAALRQSLQAASRRFLDTETDRLHIDIPRPGTPPIATRHSHHTP